MGELLGDNGGKNWEKHRKQRNRRKAILDAIKVS